MVVYIFLSEKNIIKILGLRFIKKLNVEKDFSKNKNNNKIL